MKFFVCLNVGFFDGNLGIYVVEWKTHRIIYVEHTMKNKDIYVGLLFQIPSTFLPIDF